MRKTSTKLKILSVTVLSVFSLLGIAGVFYARKVPTNYAMNQFFPKNHPLFVHDVESKKVFQIPETTPHILLLSLKKSAGKFWYDTANLEKLQMLGDRLAALKGVQSVISLGNIQSAFESKNELSVANLRDLQSRGFTVKDILKDPLYTPNLISKDGLDTAIFINPGALTQNQHKRLLSQIESTARKVVPEARVQVGGPAAIRTQFIDLLSREILVFILLSLLVAVIVIKIMFHGYSILPQMLFILVVVNALALGLMGVLHMSFNVLSSTVPIIVTITALGIASHTLVRMGEAAHLPLAVRLPFLGALLRELALPHLLTAVTTGVGFGTLMSSRVPMIADYGKAVAMGVAIAAVVTLLLLPSLYLWVSWPRPRTFLHDSQKFAYFLVHNARAIAGGIALLVVGFAFIGTHLSWTARLFDDLPSRHSASRTTALISQRLGGVVNVDFMLGSPKLTDAWKQPANLNGLKKLAMSWRHERGVGSVLTLADFLATGKDKTKLPSSRKAVAEMQFLYAMSGESPLKQFLSADEKWTRLALRLPDLPADQTRALIAKLTSQLHAQFPRMEVRTSGMAAIVPAINADISRELMWGFFESLFWIVLVLGFSFRSLRWALVAVVPNLVPPILLLGCLALFHIPIKPGIAIIFSISLGLAFCNTVYVLERLKQILKSRPHLGFLPIYSLMKKETMPCLVSSLSLFAGFSIFLFSVFPVNKLFGVFMLISIAAGLLGDLVWLPVLLRRFPWLLLEGGEGMFMKKFSLKWQAASKVAPYALLAVLGLMAFRSSYAAENVNGVLKKVEANTAPPNERVALRMIITEPGGSQKVREMTILRKNQGGARALIRLSKPADLKGLALLTISKGSAEEQYLYLPSDKKSRRILGSSKKGKFLDSEIAFEDLALSTYKDFSNKIVADKNNIIQIESRAKPGSDSSYSRLITFISRPDYHVERVDYFDKSGKPLKHAVFTKYQKLDNRYWRARDVKVENFQNKRKTELMVLQVNTKKISDDEVSQSALED